MPTPMSPSPSPPDWKARLLGIPLVGVAIPLFSGYLFRAPSGWVALWWVVESTLYTAAIWHACRAVVIYMRRHHPGFQKTGARVWRQALASVLATMAVVWILILITDAALPTTVSYWSTVRTSLIPTVIVMALYESVYFFEQWKLSLLEKEQLKRAQVQSQFDALKNQVNPHFLFNSLNTLVALIPENPAQATHFTRQLADTYRYVLQYRDHELVPLRTELAHAEAFLYLLRIRFGDNLHIVRQIPPERLDDHIAPLTLQLLLENAVKHNEVSAARPLTIALRVEGTQLVVVNNRQLKLLPPEPSTQVGLRHIVERYGLLSDRVVEVLEGNGEFAVRLPLLRLES